MPGKLNRAAGRLCTPRGFVEVAWRRVGEKWEMSVDSPVDTPVEIVLPDGSIHQSNGGAWKLEEVSA